MRANLIACVSVSLLLLFSCKKQTEELDGYAYQPERLTELLPLQEGKYITYRLDSTVFPNFGRNIEIHSYQEKNVVDARVTDNLGRTSYRIFRFLRDASGTGSWVSAGTYFITPTNSSVEFIENNLREIKLNLPVRKDYTWKGNRYLGPEPYSTFYNFSNDDSMKDWDYVYTNTDTVFDYNGTQLPDVTMVRGIDEPNFADTVTVTSTQVDLSGKSTVYLRGTASGKITITAKAPTGNTPTLAVYNRTNQTAVLDGIEVPANKGRTYEYVNGQWTFGSKDQDGKRIDLLHTELPYGSNTRQIEKYAKGIGLVYQELTLWEYQPNPGGQSPYTTCFGVRRSMIDHN